MLNPLRKIDSHRHFFLKRANMKWTYKKGEKNKTDSILLEINLDLVNDVVVK